MRSPKARVMAESIGSDVVGLLSGALTDVTFEPMELK